MTVVTGHFTDNADVIAAAASLYIKDKNIVADVTYGKGAFWRKTDVARFELKKSDKFSAHKECKQMDFCKLDFKPRSIDVLVLDPPYTHNPGKHQTDKRYNNAKTDIEWRERTGATHGMYNRDIMKLYVKGMEEAHRVLRRGGQLWVKCKDEIESGRQCWSHITLFNGAREIGFYAKDLFVVIPSSKTSHNRWAKQYHARKNHSYLWIFEK